MKIVIATGGTGGHIFPALQTAQILKERGHQVIFVGSFGSVEARVRAQGFETIVINAKGFTKKSIGGALSFSFVMVKALGQARKVLISIKPDKVIGFGGYGSFAIVLSACLQKMPTMIHEQNVVPGKANRLLGKFVEKIAISFSSSKKYLNAKKTIWTGCPCHHLKPKISREDIFKKYQLDLNRRTILVLGGSQGSQKISEVFFETISDWNSSMPIQAIHMTGIKEYAIYAPKYQNINVPVRVLEFIDPIEEAYAISDVVIARSGAATVSELGAFMIPSILVPYPLADGHQKHNAQILSQLGIAQIIEQKDLTKKKLSASLETVLNMSVDRQNINKVKADFFKDDAAKELATAVENL